MSSPKKKRGSLGFPITTIMQNMRKSVRDSGRYDYWFLFKLVDRGIPVKKLVLELLRAPKSKGRRGTLIYILQETGNRCPQWLLNKIIAENWWEARQEAKILNNQQKRREL